MARSYTQTAERQGYLICEMPERETPRARIAIDPERCSDTELVAEIIGTGTRGRSCIDLARSLIAQYRGDLAAIAQAPPAELARIEGIGKAKACRIRASLALGMRLTAQTAPSRPRVESPADVYGLLANRFKTICQEEFHILLLDTKHGLIRDDIATIGLVDRSQVHVREIFRGAIREAATRVLLALNHPSGDPTPSVQDIACTRELVAAGKIIGIRVLDHVVIGRASVDRVRPWLSFCEEGLL